MRNRAASLLARLKNKAKEQGIPLQQLINLFCQEEFIRRLSHSEYKDNLILKGGFLLYSISGFTGRPTIDADYLLSDYSNDFKAVKTLLEDVLLTDSENEFVEFKIRGLEEISKMKEYHVQTALSSTFRNRQRNYENDAVRMIARLEKDNDIGKRWENFCKKVLSFELNFKGVLDVIIQFLVPPFETLKSEERFVKIWNNAAKMGWSDPKKGLR